MDRNAVPTKLNDLIEKIKTVQAQVRAEQAQLQEQQERLKKQESVLQACLDNLQQLEGMWEDQATAAVADSANIAPIVAAVEETIAHEPKISVTPPPASEPASAASQATPVNPVAQPSITPEAPKAPESPPQPAPVMEEDNPPAPTPPPVPEPHRVAASTPTEEPQSLNERFRTQQAQPLSDRFNKAPVADLRQVIGVNEKFSFIRELFNEDAGAYDRAIRSINEQATLDTAMSYVQGELANTYAWEEDDKLVVRFKDLVKQRFGHLN